MAASVGFNHLDLHSLLLLCAGSTSRSLLLRSLCSNLLESAEDSMAEMSASDSVAPMDSLMDQVDKAVDDLQTMESCSWCLVFKQIMEMKKHGKKWACKSCLAVQQHLYRHLGSAEEPLSGMTDEEQVAFFQEAASTVDVRGGGRWKCLKAVLVESKSKVIEREQSVGVSGDYVPMSVWKARGWTEEDVLAFNDFEELPNGTKAYRCAIKSKSDVECKRSAEESLLTRERECKKRKLPKAKAKAAAVEPAPQDDWMVNTDSETEKPPRPVFFKYVSAASIL